MKVGILGGGVSGLSAAHYLLKNKKVTGIAVFEASNRLGGWVDTTCNADGIVYEHGPRTIRPYGPSGANTLALVQELGLESKVRPIIAGHATTKNRLIYVDGKLHKLPSSVLSLFRKLDPFKLPLFCAGIKDLVTPKQACDDDSMFNFVERRFGPDIAKFAIDPMLRGIFAGDAKQLSANALSVPLLDMEQSDGGVFKSVLKRRLGLSELKTEPSPFEDNEDCELVRRARAEKWAIWTLEGGLETLISALKQNLLDKGVDIFVDMEIHQVKCQNSKQVTFIGDKFEYNFNQAFMAIPAESAAKLFPTTKEGQNLHTLLSSIPYVDVAVINVEYSGKIHLHTGEAFGLLVPSSQKDIPILGIIFDTCAFPQKDENGCEKTVFTVMMGGAWFESQFHDNPDPKNLENIALEQIRTILKIDESPTRVLTKIHRKCIAQYTVGHRERVRLIREYIKENDMNINIIGSAYDGVGINDAILSSRQQVHDNNL